MLPSDHLLQLSAVLSSFPRSPSPLLPLSLPVAVSCAVSVLADRLIGGHDPGGESDEEGSIASSSSSVGRCSHLYCLPSPIPLVHPYLPVCPLHLTLLTPRPPCAFVCAFVLFVCAFVFLLSLCLLLFCSGVSSRLGSTGGQERSYAQMRLEQRQRARAPPKPKPKGKGKGNQEAASTSGAHAHASTGAAVGGRGGATPAGGGGRGNAAAGGGGRVQHPAPWGRSKREPIPRRQDVLGTQRRKGKGPPGRDSRHMAPPLNAPASSAAAVSGVGATRGAAEGSSGGRDGVREVRGRGAGGRAEGKNGRNSDRGSGSSSGGARSGSRGGAGSTRQGEGTSRGRQRWKEVTIESVIPGAPSSRRDTFLPHT